MLERKEVMPWYISVSPPYYQEEHEDQEREEITQNFEPHIPYVVEQKAAIQDIKMSRRVELILVTRQEIEVLPKTKPIVAKGVLVVVKIKYSEPRLNQQSGSIVRGVPRDWSKKIHNVNRVPRPNPPHCTYCHQIGYQINECPFIEDNVKQDLLNISRI